MLDVIGPPVFFVPGTYVDSKDVMETRDGGDVPGVAGQGARTETALVIHKISDDPFDDLEGEPGDGR